MVINFPNRINQKERVTVVAFFKSSSDDGYDMDYVEFKSEPHEYAATSFGQNLDSIKGWLADNESVEIYEASLQMVLDANGSEIANTIVYYGTSSESKGERKSNS